MERDKTTPLTLLVILSSLVSSACGTNTTSNSPANCERAPPHAQPSDGHYRLAVAGDPDLFLPGELYTVSLQGVDSGQGPNPFIGFAIWVENTREVIKSVKEDLKVSNTSNHSLGAFQAYDAQARIYEECSPSVGNATGHPKTEIQVIWSAPSMTAGECIRLGARAGPTVSDSWSVLARKLCAAPTAPASIARQPPIVEPCCACDEAKYEVTFEGMWSRNTHPREFPPESARAHFGDVIGASHTAQYRVWQEGRVASSGLRRLADDGATTALEKELKAESDHIRTIIKARGISWQQVAGAGIPSTFAVFRVDAKHHLVSLASKLAPSPDWIVGVSALELCAPNCTWTRSLTLPLYPYDAGTDNGLGYTGLIRSSRVAWPLFQHRLISFQSRRMATIPASPVRALRPDWPRDVRSPFYSTSGEMRPFARLRLARLRLYEKSCDAGESSEPAQPSSSKDGACAVHAWSAWGPCSVTCGLGHRLRQREYVRPRGDACRLELTQRELCHGLRRDCRAPSEYEPEPAQSHGPCAVTEWSEWSPCEGCGVRARRRSYVQPRAMKRCHLGYRARTQLDQAMPCDAGTCDRVPDRFANFTNFDWFYIDRPIDPECRVSEWSSWSPCSARCGRGRRLRSRVYIARDARLQDYISRRLYDELSVRFAEIQNIEPVSENITASPEIEKLSLELMEKCQFTLTMQEALCDGDDGSCDNILVSEETCEHPMSVGHCRGYQERWFYDKSRGVCEPFGYSGCGGNGNNFRTLHICKLNCFNRTVDTPTVEPSNNETLSTKKWKPTPSHQDNEVMVNDSPIYEEDVDCVTGPWLGWSECAGTCEYAFKLNYRMVKRGESGVGRGCRRVVKGRQCRPLYCRHVVQAVATTTPSSASDINADDWILEH